MKQILSPQQARDARASAKLSQGKVGSDLSINRAYLSLFEAGKYVFDDATLTRLRDYYTDRDTDPSEAPSVDPRKEAERFELAETDMPQLCDGFLVTANSDAEEVESLLAEYADNRSKIADLCSYDIRKNSFLFVTNDEVKKRTKEVLFLMARSFTIVEQLHGHQTVLPCARAALGMRKNSTGDFLSEAFGEELGFREDQEEGEDFKRPVLQRDKRDSVTARKKSKGYA